MKQQHLFETLFKYKNEYIFIKFMNGDYKFVELLLFCNNNL